MLLTFSIIMDLLLLTSTGPLARGSNILPPPKSRVEGIPVQTNLGLVPQTLSLEPAEPRIDFKLKKSPQQRFPKFRTVVDNPKPADKGNIVVIVAGNPSEREDWSVSARAHFGQAAFIFNDVFCVRHLATTLGKFPDGSVDYLIFGGHGEFCEGGVFMGIKKPPANGKFFSKAEFVIFGEHINVENLVIAENEKHRDAIVRSLARGAQVEFHVCLVGEERNLLNFAEAFQTRCWANPELVGDWGVGKYQWFYKDPIRRK